MDFLDFYEFFVIDQFLLLSLHRFYEFLRSRADSNLWMQFSLVAFYFTFGALSAAIGNPFWIWRQSEAALVGTWHKPLKTNSFWDDWELHDGKTRRAKISDLPKQVSRKARATISIRETVKLIEESQLPGFSQIATAKKHGIKSTTLCMILKDKEKILGKWNQSNNSAKAFAWKEKDQQLEDDLFIWFLNKRTQDIMMDRPLLRKQE